MLDVSDHDRVRLMTLRRPDRRNAFDRELYARSADALDQAGADGGVSVVVLTGTGPAFSAGVDVDELAAVAGGAAGTDEFVASAQRFVRTLAEFPKPLIAAVNGSAVGIGATLLGHCDVVLAGRSARFRYPFTSMGIVPEIGSSWMLPHQVGWQAAQWLLLSSRWIDATEALAMGLVLEVVADDELLATAQARGAEIAEHPLDSLVATKATYRAWRTEAISRAEAEETSRFGPLLRDRTEPPGATGAPGR